MGYTGARTASAFGQGIRGIGDTLMRISHSQAAEEEAKRLAGIQDERLGMERERLGLERERLVDQRERLGDQRVASQNQLAMGERDRADRLRDQGYAVQNAPDALPSLSVGGNSMGEALMRVARDSGMETPNYLVGEFNAESAPSVQRSVALHRATRPAPTPEATNWQLVERGGESFQVHPRTGQVRSVQLPAEAGGAGGTLAERQNNKLAGAAANANQMLDEVDSSLTDMRSAATRIPFVGGAARVTTNDEQQAAEVAALNFINPTVRYFSGAQMNEDEAKRYMQSFIPRFGDNPETVKMKRAMRQAAIRAMQSGQMRGEGADGNPDFANLDAFISDFMQRYAELPEDPAEAARLIRGGR